MNATATNGDYTIRLDGAVTNGFHVSLPRIRAFQRVWLAHALACALGWHLDHTSRCSAQHFADTLAEIDDLLAMQRSRSH